MLIGYHGGIFLSNLFGIMITHRKDTQDTYQPTSLKWGMVGIFHGHFGILWNQMRIGTDGISIAASIQNQPSNPLLGNNTQVDHTHGHLYIYIDILQLPNMILIWPPKKSVDMLLTGLYHSIQTKVWIDLVMPIVFHSHRCFPTNSDNMAA